MFCVYVSEQTNIIEVRYSDENNPTLIAEGKYSVDVSDHTVLVIFNYINIASSDHQQLDQFLFIVISYIGSLYKSLICIRFPSTFDNQIDFDKLEFQSKLPDIMSVTMDHLKYYPDNQLLEQYELITDKQLILNYAEQLLEIMNRDAFWSTEWDLKEMYDRIDSATRNVMILDKINNRPCGFGRLFLLATNDTTFGYLSHIVVDISHQSKGLGTIIVNYLVGASLNNNMNGTLCLNCAKKGSGAISASKLYKRSGFELIKDIGNRIAIFFLSEEGNQTSG